MKGAFELTYLSLFLPHLDIVKGAAAVSLQAHVSEVQHNCLSCRQPDQVDTLAVVGVIIGPVWRDDNAFAVSKGSTAAGITWQT